MPWAESTTEDRVGQFVWSYVLPGSFQLWLGWWRADDGLEAVDDCEPPEIVAGDAEVEQ